tara:strand:+ start:9573 stop:9959 length:387 start_codon:yes stop_codon:yes gene_type:complete
MWVNLVSPSRLIVYPFELQSAKGTNSSPDRSFFVDFWLNIDGLRTAPLDGKSYTPIVTSEQLFAASNQPQVCATPSASDIKKLNVTVASPLTAVDMEIWSTTAVNTKVLPAAAVKVIAPPDAPTAFCP